MVACCISTTKLNYYFFQPSLLLPEWNQFKTMLAIATIQDHNMHQMDVKTSLLNGDFSKEISFQ